MERKFTCAICNQTFNCGWSEEEALAELKEEFGDADPKKCDQVCDNCWEMVRPKNNKEVFDEWKMAFIEREGGN